MKLSIREAMSGDYKPIHGMIENELGYRLLNFEKLCARLDRMKKDDRHLTIVAEADGRTVGFIGIYRGLAYNYEGEYIQVLALAVTKEMQRKGIGALLTRWAEDYAVANDIHTIVLTSRLQREDAHAFYESKGYIKRSYGFYKEL